MAADGRSMREIAQKLYVSQTVEKHLSAAYRKLHVGGRMATALARVGTPPHTPRRAPAGGWPAMSTPVRVLTSYLPALLFALPATASAGRRARYTCR